MAELSDFQKAIEMRAYGEAQRIRDLRTPIEAGTFEGWFSPDDDKIGLSGHTIQPIFIYPKVDLINERDSGNLVDTGKNKYIWTGNWKLSDAQHKELDKNLSRALSETGLSVLPTQVKNSRKMLTQWQSENDHYGTTYPEEELGVANHHMPEGIVPYYIVRGMGGFAGATPGGTEFENPMTLVGDSVIEALAGFEGLNAFARLKMAEGMPEDEARYMGSKQSQMGTVLHEAMHMIGALPHTGDEGGLQDYTINYGGQHGENFMHAITSDIRGERSDDVGEAMRLVMGEPWNYGWGTDANPDGMTGNPITNKDEFKANVQASPHPHPHPKPHTSPRENIPISRRTVTTDPLQEAPIVPTPQDIVESTPEPTEVTEAMADNVPFKKINGVWHVMDRDTGNWETNDAWQAALEGVTKVTRNKENGRPQFHYQASPGYDFEGGSTPEGIYTADQMRARYESMAGSQETAQNIDLEEAWFNTFNIEIPDIFQRGQLDEVLYDSYTTNRQGERVPAEGAQPLIDADKLQEVLGMLEGRGALGLQEPVVVTVPGVEDAFVSVGGQTFKSKKSATGQPGATNIQDIPGTDYRMITSPTGAVSTVKKSDPTYTPGVIAETGPGSIDLPGYDILQDREGGLTPYTQRYDPSFIVDQKTMMPYFQQPDGRLEVADMPSMDDLITQYLVSGQTGKAVAMANFRDRPTSLEYFNAAMEWARSPADVFTVSAIVRGMFQPEPGPMGELRRIGAPPSWARDAWVALQSSMGISAQDITSEPGAEEGSFVAGGGDPSAVPTIQSEFGVPNVSATDQTVTTSSAEQLYTDTGFTVEEQDQAAAQDVDDVFDPLGVDMGTGDMGTGDMGTGGTGGTGGTEEEDTGWNEEEYYEGGLNQRIDRILAAGGVKQSDGSFINLGTGEQWDSFGNPIKQFEELLGEESFTVYDINAPIDIGDEGGFEAFPTTSTSANLFDESQAGNLFTGNEAVADESWMFGSAGGDDYYVPPGAYSSGVTDEVEPTEVIIGYTEPGYGRNAAGDWVVLEPSEPIYGPSESELFFSRLEEAQEVQEVPEFFPASSLSERRDERRELPFEDATKVGPANLSTPTATPMPVPHTWGVGMGSGSARAIPAYDPESSSTISEEYEWFDVPESSPTISEEYEWFDVPEPEPEPVYTYEEFEEDEGAGYQYIQEPEPVSSASEEAYWSGYDEGAEGIRTGDRFTLVGEEGPELALFPRGTEIVPLNRPAKPKQRKRLRSQFSDAIDSFAFGGFSDGGTALVGEMGPELVDLPPGAQVIPAGITEMMTGRPTRAPRSLFRQAGMRAPSAQTISNLLPEEIEVYQEMGRLAGIPEKAFEREFRSMVPMGQGGTRQARFTPRGTGRTRYGRR